jgi:hypothetical protein
VNRQRLKVKVIGHVSILFACSSILSA